MKNKTLFYYIGLLLIILIIQSTRFDFWTIYGIKPDLVLLLLFVISFREGSIIGTAFGFFGGLAQDFLSNGILGSGAFAKSLWGRLMSSPLGITTYFLGMQEFASLLEAEKKRQGEHFRTIEFMDTILRAGPIPLDEFPEILKNSFPESK